MMSNFAQSQAQLDRIEMQQSDLRRAVDAGELWMDADVAEAAAATGRFKRSTTGWSVRGNSP